MCGICSECHLVLGVGAGAGWLCLETRAPRGPHVDTWTGDAATPPLTFTHMQGHTRRVVHPLQDVKTHTPLVWSHHRVTHTRPHVHVYVPTDMVMGRSQHPPTYVCGDICTIRCRCRHTHTHSHGLRDVHPPVSTHASHSLHVHSQVASNLPPYDQLSAQVRTEDED